MDNSGNGTTRCSSHANHYPLGGNNDTNKSTHETGNTGGRAILSLENKGLIQNTNGCESHTTSLETPRSDSPVFVSCEDSEIEESDAVARVLVPGKHIGKGQKTKRAS